MTSLPLYAGALKDKQILDLQKRVAELEAQLSATPVQPAPSNGDLIAGAERHAAVYDGDDRQDIKTDVLNAFYAGAHWRLKAKPAQDATSDDSDLAEHKAWLARNVKRVDPAPAESSDAPQSCKDLPEEEWKRRYAAELVRLGVLPSHAKACAEQWYGRASWDDDDSPEYAAETDLDAARS